jgi:uncharacterized protein YegP (UPF0339 family)
MYFDIFKSTTGGTQKYWWVAKGNNHEPMCHSEMLSSKQACINAIKTIKSEAAAGSVYDETGERSGDVDARRISNYGRL